MIKEFHPGGRLAQHSFGEVSRAADLFWTMKYMVALYFFQGSNFPFLLINVIGSFPKRTM